MYTIGIILVLLYGFFTYYLLFSGAIMKTVEEIKEHIKDTIENIEADKHSDGYDYYLAGFLRELLNNIEGKDEPEA